jgi:branched-chain amino acid aminotransferase
MAGFPGCKKIWMNGKMVNFEDAKIHVLSHVVHYGSANFEGDRCYDTPNGPMVFRLMDHVERLFNSCKIYRMEIPYTKQQVFDACLETIRANNLKDCYLRPIAYRGFAQLGVDPTGCPIDLAIAVWDWGKYLGPEALEKGVDVRVSSWNRMAPNTFPYLAKSAANYMNSQLIKLEAKMDGYVEGIALDTFGMVSEGSGENIFVVHKGKIITPPLCVSVLPGITRDSVIRLARDLGYELIEQGVPRELLYIADEVFFTGSAAEITPLRSIDKIVVGEGKRGPVTAALQKAYFDIIEGRVPDKYGWLTKVY